MKILTSLLGIVFAFSLQAQKFDDDYNNCKKFDFDTLVDFNDTEMTCLKIWFLGKSDSLNIPKDILLAKNLKAIKIIYNRGQKSIFEDSTHFIWQLPNLEYVEILYPLGKHYSSAIRYNITEQTLYLPDFEQIFFKKLQQFFFIHKVKSLKIDSSPSLGSYICSCNFNIEELYWFGQTGDTLPQCMENIQTLKSLTIKGRGKSLVDASNLPNLRRLETNDWRMFDSFNVWQMSNLDTLIAPNYRYKGQRPKLSEIRLDSIKYLDLGEQMPEKFSKDFVLRLRKQLPLATIKITRSWYKTEGYSSLAIATPGNGVLDIAFLPSNVFRWGLHYQPGFRKEKDKHGSNYTGGVHAPAIGGGMLIGGGYIRGFIELKYDYFLPSVPLFFGFATDLYMDAKNQQYAVYARPRIGTIVGSNGLAASVWYSYGIPLAEKPMDGISGHEVGLSFFFPLPVDISPFVGY